MKRDRKKINIFERKAYRRILGPVHENKKENWRIFANKQIYSLVIKPTITETIRLNRLRWFGKYREWKKTKFQKSIIQ